LITPEIANSAIALINRAQISGAEAEAAVQVKQAILAAAQPKDTDDEHETGEHQGERPNPKRASAKSSPA